MRTQMWSEKLKRIQLLGRPRHRWEGSILRVYLNMMDGVEDLILFQKKATSNQVTGPR